jgi:hypothetical protein
MLLALALCLAAPGIAAREAAGIKFEDKASVAGRELVLNGVGVRVRLVIKAYSMGLYLPEKKGAAADVISAPGPKRAHLVLLRDLTAEQFVDALQDGVRKNHSEADLAKIQPRLDEFSKNIMSIKEAAKGTTILIDYLPESGTRLTVNGQVKGKDVSGDDFYRAVLRVWLGDKPVDADLKAGLLGI